MTERVQRDEISRRREETDEYKDLRAREKRERWENGDKKTER